jgi:hypothetical protein
LNITIIERENIIHNQLEFIRKHYSVDIEVNAHQNMYTRLIKN